jgi:hypothetical protein
MYYLAFMVGRRSKTMACVWEMAGIGAEGEGEWGDMVRIMTRKLMFFEETSHVSLIELAHACF